MSSPPPRADRDGQMIDLAGLSGSTGCAPYASQCSLPFLPDELPNVNLITDNGLRICLHAFIFAGSSSPADWGYGVAQAKHSVAYKVVISISGLAGFLSALQSASKNPESTVMSFSRSGYSC